VVLVAWIEGGGDPVSPALGNGFGNAHWTGVS